MCNAIHLTRSQQDGRERTPHNGQSARLNEAMHTIARRFGRDVALEAGEFFGYVSRQGEEFSAC